MTQLERVNPYFSVWLHPKRTTRYILQNKSFFFTMIIISVGFIGILLSLLVDSELYPTLPIWGIILLIIVLSPILGLLSNSLFALELWLIGKLFKGIGEYKDIFKAISLFNIPYVFMIPFYLIWLFIEPISLFYDYENGMFFLPTIDLVLNFIITIWCLVITIPIVSEVHNIPYWKSFFILLISSLILLLLIIVPILIIIIFTSVLL